VAASLQRRALAWSRLQDWLHLLLFWRLLQQQEGWCALAMMPFVYGWLLLTVGCHLMIQSHSCGRRQQFNSARWYCAAQPVLLCLVVASALELYAPIFAQLSEVYVIHEYASCRHIKSVYYCVLHKQQQVQKVESSQQLVDRVQSLFESICNSFDRKAEDKSP
jgi:hypothetical protein